MMACWRKSLPQLLVALLAAGAELGSSFILHEFDVNATVRTLIALAPIPFFILLAWTMVRGVGRLDELQRRVMFESLAIGFAGASLLFIVYDQFMDAEIGLPAMQLEWVIDLMVLIWIGGYAIAASRYR